MVNGGDWIFLPVVSSLGDLTVVAGAVLRGALGRSDGFGAFQAVPLAAPTVGHRVGASMHHDCVHPVCHGERLQMAFDGDGQRQFVDQVHRRARNYGTTAQILQAEHWESKQMTRVNLPPTMQQ